MTQPADAPEAIDSAFLQHVCRSTTSYSEGWRDVCARLQWVEAALAACHEERTRLKELNGPSIGLSCCNGYAVHNEQCLKSKAYTRTAEQQLAALTEERDRLKELARKEHELLMSIARRLKEIDQIGDAPDTNMTGAIHGVIDGFVTWKAIAKAAEADLAALRSGLDALVEKWKLHAASVDTYHATMSIGWKACATELADTLRATIQRTDDANL